MYLCDWVCLISLKNAGFWTKIDALIWLNYSHYSRGQLDPKWHVWHSRHLKKKLHILPPLSHKTLTTGHRLVSYLLTEQVSKLEHLNLICDHVHIVTHETIWSFFYRFDCSPCHDLAITAPLASAPLAGILCNILFHSDGHSIHLPHGILPCQHW